MAGNFDDVEHEMGRVENEEMAKGWQKYGGDGREMAEMS